MSGSEDHGQIVAALLWDVPSLRRGSQSGKDFVDGLIGGSDRWWETREPEDDALGRAAIAVAHERAGELDTAAGTYAELSADTDSWVRLLGLMLRAWSEGEEGSAPILQAESELDGLKLADGRLEAHLRAKLATYAFDEGDGDLGVAILKKAIALAPDESMLRWALAIEGLNVGLGIEWSEEEPERAPDPLVEYPWIEVDAQRAAQATLSAIVESRSRRVWTFQWGMGRTPLDDVVSAEVQATWAGALWMRRTIRKQLGAQLLSGAARSPRQWAYGVIMWTLGGGQNPERAYALAEPRFDGESADFIVGALTEAEVSPRFSHRLISTAVEAWDELSEDMLRTVVKLHEPTDSDHPAMQEVRRLWAGYAARLTEEWLANFRELEFPTQASLLDALGAGAAEGFPADAKQAIFQTASQAIRERDSIDVQLLRVLAAVTPDPLKGSDLQREISEKASAGTIARLGADGQPGLFTSDAVDEARRSLIETVENQSEEARQGTVSFGAGDPRVDLGHLIASYGDEGEDGVGLLMETALDGGLPSEHLLNARNALTLIRRAKRLGSAKLRTLHAATDPPGSFSAHAGISRELIKASRLRILAEDLDPKEIASVVELCRAPEDKVRNIALASCAEAVETGREGGAKDALSWSLVGGLFDPEDENIGSVAYAFTSQFIERFPIAGEVAVSRFPRLLEIGDMSVRAAVRTMAKDWSSEEQLASSSTVRELLARTDEDRSWLVRNA